VKGEGNIRKEKGTEKVIACIYGEGSVIKKNKLCARSTTNAPLNIPRPKKEPQKKKRKKKREVHYHGPKPPPKKGGKKKSEALRLPIQGEKFKEKRGDWMQEVYEKGLL